MECQYCRREIKSPFNWHERGDCEEAYKMLLDELKWKKIKVGSDGFVCLVDVMGTDKDVCDAARLSYGAGTKSVSDDRNLIRYLYRHAHTSPFEQVEFKFLMRLPMDIHRQLVRHRTASLNEYSTRYSVAIDATSTTEPDQWRLQADDNKQGSTGTLTDWPAEYKKIDDYYAGTVPDDTLPCIIDTKTGLSVCHDHPTPGEHLSNMEKGLQHRAREVYNERLRLGIAREQARKDLPLSTYTEIYWKIDLRNLLHFLSLRMDDHAQLEIREYANAIYDIAKQLCPMSVDAFDTYDPRRGGVLLTKHEVDIIRHMQQYGVKNFDNAIIDLKIWPVPPAKCREREEARDKLMELGLI